MDSLRSICSVYSPDVVCIVETWLDDTISNSEIFIQGYSLCRLDRSRHGGGVLFFVKSMFTYSLLFKGTPDFECLIMSVKCSVGTSGPDFTVALFYRPPNSSHALLDTLFTILCNCFLSSCKVFLVGDFNIDYLVPTTPLYHKLLSIVSSFNLTQVVSIVNAIKKRDALFRIAKLTGKSTDRVKYTTKKKQVTDMLRESKQLFFNQQLNNVCLLYTSPSPRDATLSRMPSSA